MLQLTHRAMACDFVVMVPDEHSRVAAPDGRQRAVADVVLDCLEAVDEVEAALTIYRNTSEIAQVNEQAGDRPVAVSRETFSLLQTASELCRTTGGAFDITAGPLVDAWGFTRREGRKPTKSELTQALARVGYQSLELDPDQCTVRFTRPGMRLNLGGIGKGEAIDRLADGLQRAGVNNFLIHAGNSSVLAKGHQFPSALNADQTQTGQTGQPPGTAEQAGGQSITASNADQQPVDVEHPLQNAPSETDESSVPPGWLVGIAHPTKPNRRLCGIWLHNSALATSGSGKQFFHHRGKRFGHVMDPRTGYPAGDLLSLTVVAPRAVDADAIATGLFVMGSTEAAQLADRLGYPLLCVAPTDRQDDVNIEAYGRWIWAEPLSGFAQSYPS